MYPIFVLQCWLIFRNVFPPSVRCWSCPVHMSGGMAVKTNPKPRLWYTFGLNCISRDVSAFLCKHCLQGVLMAKTPERYISSSLQCYFWRRKFSHLCCVFDLFKPSTCALHVKMGHAHCGIKRWLKKSLLNHSFELRNKFSPLRDQRLARLAFKPVAR